MDALGVGCGGWWCVFQKWREENLDETFSKLASTSRETGLDMADRGARPPKSAGGEREARDKPRRILI